MCYQYLLKMHLRFTGLLLPLARAVTKSSVCGRRSGYLHRTRGEDWFWACNMLGYVAILRVICSRTISLLRGYHQIQMCHKPVKTDCAAAQQVHHKASRSDWLHSVTSCVLLTIFFNFFSSNLTSARREAERSLEVQLGRNCAKKLRTGSYHRYTTTHTR